VGLALAFALDVGGFVRQWQVPNAWARIFMVAVLWAVPGLYYKVSGGLFLSQVPCFCICPGFLNEAVACPRGEWLFERE
jgi:hypothetical protein